MGVIATKMMMMMMMMMMIDDDDYYYYYHYHYHIDITHHIYHTDITHHIHHTDISLLKPIQINVMLCHVIHNLSSSSSPLSSPLMSC